MLDVSFKVSGESVPIHHAEPLWDQLRCHLPWLDAATRVAVMPLKGSIQGMTLILARRSRLVLRIPQPRVEDCLQLTGNSLTIDGNPLDIGGATLRPLISHPSLHGHRVLGPAGEDAFLDWVRVQLSALGIEAPLICGQAERSAGNASWSYSLVIHHLKPEHSLQLLEAGMGPDRHLGHGIFVPYKTIPDLD